MTGSNKTRAGCLECPRVVLSVCALSFLALNEKKKKQQHIGSISRGGQVGRQAGRQANRPTGRQAALQLVPCHKTKRITLSLWHQPFMMSLVLAEDSAEALLWQATKTW